MPAELLITAPPIGAERRKSDQPWNGIERRRGILPSRWDDALSARQEFACIALSLLLHGLILAGGWHWPAHEVFNSIIEVDLTAPYEIVPPHLARLARPVRKGVPDGSGKAIPLKAPEPPAASAPSAASSSPRPMSPASPEPRSGSLTGAEDGVEVQWVALTFLPKLLNRDRLAGVLRAHYPEKERQAGHEGRVILDLHVDASGRVISSQVVQSAGDDFDQAARAVAKLFEFEPARIGIRTVPVKIRQAIVFRLSD